jgi:hypothetical protein
MTLRTVSNRLNYFIATVWFVNGLICKVLNLVPRHQEIVARILDINHARVLTLLIGLAEIGMAIWILSGIRPRLNTVLQIILIGIMNMMEFVLVPDKLLWGKANIVFATMFMLLIYHREFHLNKKFNQKTACYPS